MSCLADIQACPGDTVQIVEEERENATYEVFLDDKGGGSTKVEDSFEVQEDSASVQVIVIYGGGDGGGCKVGFDPPNGIRASACFTRQGAEPKRIVTKYFDCDGA